MRESIENEEVCIPIMCIECVQLCVSILFGVGCVGPPTWVWFADLSEEGYGL